MGTIEWEMIFTVILVGITLIVNKVIDGISAKKMREQIDYLHQYCIKQEQINEKNTEKIDDLYNCHLGPSAIDDDGAPKWWIKKSYEETIRDLHISIKALTDLLKEWRLETKLRHKYGDKRKNTDEEI